MRRSPLVRLLLIAATLGALGSSATACPPIEACLVRLRSTVKEPAPAVVETTGEAIRTPAPKRKAPGEIEMPWIWRALRENFYARMPRYEQPRQLLVVLSPVVVSSPADTVPGVGVSGKF